MTEQHTKDAQVHTPGSAATGLPVDWLPGPAEAGIALKGGELLIKGGAKAYEWIKSKGPLHIEIQDSATDDDGYLVKLRAVNLTEHGLYLDALVCTFPIEAQPEVFPHSDGQMRLGETPEDRLKRKSHALPLLIPSSTYKTVGLLFAPTFIDALRVRINNGARPGIQCRVSYSMLNEFKPRTIEDLPIRMRV